MRKLIILSLLLFGFTYSNAQKLNFGLKFSPHFSWFKIDNKDSISNEGVGIMFSYGLTCDFNFAENYALNIEINQVFLNNSTRDSKDKILKYKLQNIEIPIALKMKTNDIDNMKYFGRFGLCPSINTTSKVNDPNEKVTRLNFGMIIGAGFQYKLADKTR